MKKTIQVPKEVISYKTIEVGVREGRPGCVRKGAPNS